LGTGLCEVFVEEHEQHGVELHIDVDSSKALARFAVRKKASAFDPQLSLGALAPLDGVVPGLPRGAEFDLQNARGLVFRHFAGNAEGFADCS
jgi:hypothetical protein